MAFKFFFMALLYQRLQWSEYEEKKSSNQKGIIIRILFHIKTDLLKPKALDLIVIYPLV